MGLFTNNVLYSGAWQADRQIIILCGHFDEWQVDSQIIPCGQFDDFQVCSLVIPLTGRLIHRFCRVVTQFDSKIRLIPYVDFDDFQVN